MAWFVVACLFWLVAIVGIGGAFRRPRSNDPTRGSWLRLAAVGAALGMGVYFLASLFSVGANSVGIVTSFGAPKGTVASGQHLLAPWDSIDTYSTRVQVTSRLADPSKGDVAGADCVQTNLNGGASACVDVTVRYVVNAQDAVQLWRNYGDFSTVRDVFLRTAVNNAVKIVYGQYTPQQVVNGAPLPQIAAALTAELSKQLGDSGLTLVAISPGQVWLSRASQQRFDDVLNAQTDVQVAQQQLAKDEALAKANQALTGSLSTGVLIEQCIQAAQQIKPAYFNCYPSGSGAATPLLNIGGK